jgi:quinol monooxygenase YgiN
MIRVVCKAKLKSGVNVEEYLILAREVVTETRKEKGCIMYTSMILPSLAQLKNGRMKRLSTCTIKVNMS